MDIYKGASEKISLQNREGQFHTREFSASRKVTIPDDSKPTLIRLEEVRIDLELKKQILTNFLLEGVITSEQMQTRLQPYKDLLAKAEEAHDPNPF
jgi:hypothetical protein